VGGLDDAAAVMPGQELVDSISIVNAQIDLDFTYFGGFNVAIWSQNLFDNEHFTTGFALDVLGLGLAQRITGEPQ